MVKEIVVVIVLKKMKGWCWFYFVCVWFEI